MGEHVLAGIGVASLMLLAVIGALLFAASRTGGGD